MTIPKCSWPQTNFTGTSVLMRPYNIYEPHWNTAKDLGTSFKYSANAWMNRISADPETEEKYNRSELERLGIYQNPDWMRNRMIWQKPGNTTAITNHGEGEWMYSNPDLRSRPSATNLAISVALKMSQLRT